jgi:aminoglycoside phosphotransferase (APT) family kinase protein
MRYLSDAGYPVPAVYEVDGGDMVMERIAGPTMAEAMVAGSMSLPDAIRMLADLHAGLHAIPAQLSADPADRIIHLDLHAENVLIGADGPVVIDWSNAIEGPPDFDVAVSALIMAEIAVDPAHPLADLVRPAVPLFLSFTGVPPWKMVERAVAMRMANPSLRAEEKARLADAAAMLR